MHLAEIRDTISAPVIAWDECACLLCGSATYTPVCEAADRRSGLRFLLVQCDQCDLCFTNPRPDPICIKRFYPVDYRCHHGKDRAGKTNLPVQGLGRLLDFGCGGGDFLRRMHACGWIVTGLDMADAAVASVRALGLTAHVGTLPSPLWGDECFEAITMWQSLEHTHQPLEVLRAAYRMLTIAGRLFVTVPNFAGFGARWFGGDWYGLDVPRHLTHFTPRTLRMMLAEAGFTHIELKQQPHHSWIRHSANGGFLATRVGSRIAGAWGRLWDRAESIQAIAKK
jgi:2-polyprenyl-3-methyl-5-hydroxy-6-metoxy-1,4-benzoquinol methylase